MSRTCSGVTSSICCFASSIRSCPVLWGISRSGFVSGDCKLSHLRVECSHGAEWKGPLLVDVSDRNPRHARNPELVGDFAEDLVEWPTADGVVGTFDAFTEHDCLAAVEGAGEH